MSDPISTSRAARESLARGLNALQADPSVPAHLVDLAQPIAQAMGALHQIERSQQLMPHAEVALGHVRGALNKLQAQPPTHPAVTAALEAVAGSLNLVHTLSKMAGGGAPHAPPPQPPPAPQAPPPPAAPHGPPPGYGQAAPAPAFPQQPAQPAFPNAGPPQGAPPPMVARDPFASPPAGPPPAGPPGYGRGGAPPGAAQAPPPGQPIPAPPAGNLQVVAADLGAHSPTNFYKGLSGNDIVDHGGLFVSTYVSPKVGTPVRLKVSLPGGYEFEANAVVKWTREQGGDAPPGFGAKFTQISPEARQLIYRYVRNREPLFHDDM